MEIVIAAALSALPAPALAEQAKAGWELVGSDEFNSDKLDRKKWKAEKSCWGGGNEERQCYTGRKENIRVADGLLHLMAREEKFTGADRPPEIASMPNPNRTQPFTSGKIRTRGIASWKYGKIEFRAKPPKGQGTWPAVWMMPADDQYGAWPLSGEIDLMEAVNLGASCNECGGAVGENRTLSAIHFGDKPPKNTHIHKRVALPDNALPSDAFHTWTFEWGAGLMRFYLDGRQYWEVKADQLYSGSPKAKGNPIAPFDKPFYIMANLAIGGKLSEDNNDKGIVKDVVPANFLIDWIRIYQCKDDRETGLSCMKGVEGGK
jgi:beta-glucanase (GH16 family)